MPGRSTTDAIFGLIQTVEKHREGQKDFNFVFIDIEKADDRIPREEMWRCAREQQDPDKCIRVIQDMYQECETRVRSTAGESSNFKVDVGLRQGSALSPFLFRMVTDRESEKTGTRVDVVLCGRNEVDMTEYLESSANRLA